ncbi:MAG: UDP-glucose 4-epimerase GalE [Treponemataceae bacterium]|nr:UDP-glucose 4-epimerase GalE [Treponemataceae bacterium]
MKTLVIGGAGYIGSHVVKALMKQGHEVTVFDNLSSGLRQNLFKQNKFIYGNILIKSDLDSAFSLGFDACIHLAAFKAAGESMLVPEKYSENNITGTLNILNSAVKHNCKNIVFSSSAAIFGNPQKLPIDENHPKNPENYYGFTKLSIEDYLEWYSKLKGINYSALRYFNAAGYDIEGEISGLEQNPANLIPVVMETACGIRKQMSVFGDDYDTPDGTCIRDYVHVTDLADAHVKALDYIAKNNANLKLNLGSEVGTSVKEVIDIARKITGKAIDAKIVERRPGDPSELYATSKQAFEILGWKAKYSDMETIIKTTWDAYLKNM